MLWIFTLCSLLLLDSDCRFSCNLQQVGPNCKWSPCPCLKDSLRTKFKSLSLSWSLCVNSLSLSLSLHVQSLLTSLVGHAPTDGGGAPALPIFFHIHLVSLTKDILNADRQCSCSRGACTSAAKFLEPLHIRRDTHNQIWHGDQTRWKFSPGPTHPGFIGAAVFREGKIFWQGLQTLFEIANLLVTKYFKTRQEHELSEACKFMSNNVKKRGGNCHGLIYRP